jgi:penicillin amidase
MTQQGRPKRSHWVLRILLGVAACCALLALGVYGFLRGSLATLDGEVKGNVLRARVTVTRDALGIPTITAGNRLDAAYVTGYLHAQDRFFQMDLLRRVAAGELSELFGRGALEIDRRHRRHRFRARAAGFLQSQNAADRAMLDRYVEGVNDGLTALAARPFEYGLLMTKPRPWSAADSLLVVWAMYFDLQGNLESRELARGWLRDHSTQEQLAFLLPEASRFDAPLDAPEIKVTTPIPAEAPAWLGPPTGDTHLADSQHPSVGSNNWAVAGTRTVHGGAIVANDMHLSIRLPHIWYRMQISYSDDQGELRHITGVTLPGQPLVVVGSNGHVAWGFTNSYGDYLDLVEVQRDPADDLRIRLGDHWERATEHTELLAVKDRPAVALKVIDTSLGPIRDIGGRAFAVHWVAHEPGAVNLNLSQLEGASDLADAQAVANIAGIPAQNMVAGDSHGHIGWTIAGPLPDREVAPAASFPFKAEAGLSWTRLRSPDSYPRLVDPAQGQIWTANNRQLAGDQYLKIGDGGADLSARARQVRDDLTALGTTNELAVYGVALDDRALFVDEWRNRALRALSDPSTEPSPLRAEFRRLLRESWGGEASIDSVGYRLARAYEYAVYVEMFGAVDSELKKLDDEASFDNASTRWPVVAAALLDGRPMGWLPAGRTWAQLELAAVDRAIREVTRGGQSLASATWGSRNIVAPAHPFVKAMPLLRHWLSAPATPMAGDENMPKFASPTDGQSERMTVSPGREAQGIFNMPGGASGHPLSPYFLAGHAAWLKGEPTPFLPGPTVHTLTFVPNPQGLQ